MAHELATKVQVFAAFDEYELPIHADKSNIVYVEVEGRRSSFILWHVSRTGNKQTTLLLFLAIYPLSIACYVTQENDVLVLYYKVINKNE